MNQNIGEGELERGERVFIEVIVLQDENKELLIEIPNLEETLFNDRFYIKREFVFKKE